MEHAGVGNGQGGGSADYRSLDAMQLERRSAPALMHEFRLIFSQEVFDRMRAQADAAANVEVGGVLVGEVLKDESGPYLLVQHSIEALHAKESGAELTFTQATWGHIHQQMESEPYLGKRIVGWYHTHPGFGIFLSERDQFIQQSFFDLPFQVALVYDPKSFEHGAFVWREGKLHRARRYWVGGVAYEYQAPPPKSEPAAKPAAAEATRVAPQPVAGPALPDLRGLDDWRLVVLFGCVILAAWFGYQMGAIKNQSEARQEAVENTVRSINNDFLGLLRDSIGDEALGKRFEDVRKDLEAAVAPARAAAATNPQLSAALQQIDKAQGVLRDATENRRLAQEMLKRLSSTSYNSQAVLDKLSQRIDVQGAALGELLHNLSRQAERAGDRNAAIETLRVAATVDAANRQVYEQEIRRLNGRGLLGRLFGGA